MALLPDKPQSQTVTAIYAYWAARKDKPRAYLGGSAIGRECERELWYSFRWCGVGASFDGRMLRLFNRGHREEAVFVEELRGIGCDVRDIDPSTGEQFRFKAIHGHAAGGIDGVALKVPEAPKTWHLLEFKTSNAKSWATLARDGVEKAKPEHYAQMQLYMRWAQLERALYLAVNKDNDEIHGERVRYDAAAAERLEQKAERIIFSAEPLPRLSEDAAFWKCKGCAFAAGCHGTKLPGASCRTCLHATPEKDGDGRWSCAKWGAAEIPLDTQQQGCEKHLFIPALLQRWGEVRDASEAEGWVEYEAKDGHTFRNGAWGLHSFTSKELHAMTPAMLRDAEVLAIREKTAAQFCLADRGEFEEAA